MGPPPRLAVLANPAAGRGAAGRTARTVADRLTAAGSAVSLLVGDTADHSRRLVADAVGAGVDGVVVVGGDGIVHLAVQALAGTSTALGLVPSGTGNDFARALGIPRRHPVAATELVLAGHRRSIDLARLDAPGAPPDGPRDVSDGPPGAVAAHRWFDGVMTAGFDSRVTARANRMRRPRGSVRYVLAVLAELHDTAPVELAIEVDGRVHTHRATLAAVGNTAYYGGGIAMCAGAEPDDGLLDVVVVDRVSPGTLLALFPLAAVGRHLRLPVVTRYRGREVRLSSPSGADLLTHADGEPFARLPVALTCVPGALQVYAAPSAPTEPDRAARG